jgi:hypothetical protein
MPVRAGSRFFIPRISEENPERFIDYLGKKGANTKKGGETESTGNSDMR